jgi:predicted O-methyltransferase YrrM
MTARERAGELSWRIGHRLTRPGIEPVEARLSDALALSELAPLGGGYVPWTVASMRPRGIATVLNAIAIRERRTIVECGGGASTIFIARLLARVGGHLWTLEHEADWARQLEQIVAEEGHGENVTIVVAPLENGWYATSALDDATPKEGIDLLLVDGPPAVEDPLARYPAVPYFRPRLAEDATIVVDDIVRPGEQEIVARWERELGVEFEHRPLEGRVAVAHTRPGFGV